MAKPGSRTVGRSRTQKQPPGKTIPVLSPDDMKYLCSHVCHCNCNAKFTDIAKNGDILRQRCVTNAIRAECDARNQVWKYKGEVGYSMVPYFKSRLPPVPLMSRDTNPPRPSSFPLGAAKREGVFSKDDFEGKPQSGLLRIPDVVIVRDMHDFSLRRPNIEFIVEMKFGKDSWRPGQRQAYALIAGDPDRVKELTPGLCKCKPCEEPKRVPVPVPVLLPLPKNRTAEDKTKEWEKNHQGGWSPQPGYASSGSMTLGDYLLSGAEVVGVVAVVILAVAGAPVVATVAGTLLVVGAAAAN